jgi:hypothetical protein
MIRFSRWLDFVAKHILNRPLQGAEFVSSVFGLLLFTTPLALASSNSPSSNPSHNASYRSIVGTEIRYTPPAEPSYPQGSTTSTGHRGGCGTAAGPGFTALAPQSYVGQTTASQPTFAWFVPDTQSFPIEIYLYERRAGGRQLLVKDELQSSPGIMSWSVPATQQSLNVGQRYFWQAVLLCNPDSPSSAVVVGAEIEVVAPPGNLERELANTHDRLTRSQLFAAAGLWYDAFQEVITTQGGEAVNARLNLLRDLANSEGSAASSNRQQQVRLQQIVEFERNSP